MKKRSKLRFCSGDEILAYYVPHFSRQAAPLPQRTYPLNLESEQNPVADIVAAFRGALLQAGTKRREGVK